MIVVTGAAGFIGSNLVRALNNRGHDNVLAVDDLHDGKKIFNLAIWIKTDLSRPLPPVISTQISKQFSTWAPARQPPSGTGIS